MFLSKFNNHRINYIDDQNVKWKKIYGFWLISVKKQNEHARDSGTTRTQQVYVAGRPSTLIMLQSRKIMTVKDHFSSHRPLGNIMVMNVLNDIDSE